MQNLKQLLYDIEIVQTTLGDAWRTMSAPSSILISFSYIWYDDYLKGRQPKNLNLLTTGEFHELNPLKTGLDDKLVQKVHEVMMQADILVGHYSTPFDGKYLHAKFLRLGLPDFKHIEQRDTCLTARRFLKLGSNRLNSLADFFGVPRKIEIDHKHWMGVWNRRESSMRTIARYNDGDVLTLGGVYQKMMPLFNVQQHVGALMGNGRCSCKYCGGTDMLFSKRRTTATGMLRIQLQCGTCGKYQTVAPSIFEKETGICVE